MIGDLHCLDLGVVQSLAGTAFCRILQSGSLGNLTTEQGLKKGCVILTHKMRRWYSEQRKSCRLRNLSLKRLGWSTKSAWTGDLKAKGMESRVALRFCAHLLDKSMATRIIKGSSLRKAIKALCQAFDLMKKSDRTIDGEKLEKYFRACFRRSQRAGVALLPKFHLMTHLGALAKRAGNPKCYSEYGDESHNKAVVRVAQACCFPLGIPRAVLTRELLLRETMRLSHS